MEFDLSAPESQLLQRLLRDHQSALARNPAAGAEEEVQLVERLLRKLTHPMRGGVEQSDGALMSDVGESIAPEIPDEQRKL
jgi:hypothetical protein